KSSLRKINFNTGEIINMINLEYEYFGEGLTVLNDKIYQLTWKNRIGFIYDLELNNIGTFNYGNSQEGWGLCNDGNYIYKSDGTSKIWRLDPNTLEEIDFIDVMTDKSRIKNINELEYIDGKIFANTYQQNRDVVIVINPSNGIVENVIDFSGLRDKVLQKADLDVMNGIAYNKGKLFVTGKNWNKIFEVKVYSKN
ncbi:glutaminyl-peptide cyclotransferase, partial [Flavobacteriaceae bacterium]|nr:glutaminyl-peptide cyclotransferase [Flavobacteriaceae bacterium]